MPSGVAEVLAVGGAEKGKKTKYAPFVFLHASQCLIFCHIFYLRCAVLKLISFHPEAENENVLEAPSLGRA